MRPATHRPTPRPDNSIAATQISTARVRRLGPESLSENANQAQKWVTGQVNVGAISGPALSFVPTALAQVAQEYPRVRLRLQVESSDHLLQALQTGRIEVMVGRLLEHYDTSNYSYTRLSDEPMCAVARKSHPLLKHKTLQMRALAEMPWIVPQIGTILRHRFDFMFRDAGYSVPNQIIEAVSQMVVPRLVQETNYLAVLGRDVAKHYASCGMICILPIELPCDLDSFGVVTRKGRALSAAALALCKALEASVNKSNVSHRSATQKRKF
jgi:DNA-binding transcriptional LysR family regulator